MPVVVREISLTYGSVAVGSVAAAAGGNTAYTMEDTNGDGTVPSWILADGEIAFYVCSNAVNNGTFLVVSVAGLVVTVVNAAGIVEAASPGLAAIPVAGVSNYHMHDKHKKGNAYKTAVYDFNVRIETADGTAAAEMTSFNAKCLSLERAFRVPRQRLRSLFTVNSVVYTFDDRNPANASGGNTGFNAESSIEKTGDEYDTGRSRSYSVHIEIQLPADLPGQSGRQDSSVDLSFDASRIRTITISGRYTALGANAARAQYNASIATYAAAVQAAIGGTYEIISEVATADDADKNLDFTQVYREIIYSQSAAGLNHAAIVAPRFVYSRQRVAPGDTGSDTRRLEVITVDFGCSVDKDVTTDLSTLYTGTIRPYLIAQAFSQFGSSSGALVDENYAPGPDGNTISVQMTFNMIPEAASNLVQHRRSVTTFYNTGKIIVPIWDGNAFSKHVYDGPADLVRTIKETKLLLGVQAGSGAAASVNNAAGGLLAGARITFNFANGFSQAAFGPNSGAAQTALVQAALSDGPPPGGGGGDGQPGPDGYIGLTDMVTVTPITIGLPGYQLDLTELERETVETYVETPSGGGGGGGRPETAT
jgi:hypothetical protein